MFQLQEVASWTVPLEGPPVRMRICWPSEFLLCNSQKVEAKGALVVRTQVVCFAVCVFRYGHGNGNDYP